MTGQTVEGICVSRPPALALALGPSPGPGPAPNLFLPAPTRNLYLSAPVPQFVFTGIG